MNPTKNLIEANLYTNPTKHLIELKHYMSSTKNLIEPKLYMSSTRIYQVFSGVHVMFKFYQFLVGIM
jgi:hypothetical protein